MKVSFYETEENHGLRSASISLSEGDYTVSVLLHRGHQEIMDHKGKIHEVTIDNLIAALQRLKEIT